MLALGFIRAKQYADVGQRCDLVSSCSTLSSDHFPPDTVDWGLPLTYFNVLAMAWSLALIPTRPITMLKQAFGKKRYSREESPAPNLLKRGCKMTRNKLTLVRTRR